MMGSGYAINPFTGKMEWVGRLKRPGYYRDADNSLLIHVDASATKLVHLCIGNRVYLVQSGMTCNLGAVGLGGLDMGEVQANTPYYLYAVISGGNAHLVASVRAPGDGGPQGYTPWTYIGAVATVDSSAVLPLFSASGGFLFSQGQIDTAAESTTAGSYQSKTIAGMPSTVLSTYWKMRILPTANGIARGYLSGGGGSNISLEAGTLSEEVEAFPWLVTPTPGTIYLYITATTIINTVYLQGWQEDPTQWP